MEKRQASLSLDTAKEAGHGLSPCPSHVGKLTTWPEPLTQAMWFLPPAAFFWEGESSTSTTLGTVKIRQLLGFKPNTFT